MSELDPVALALTLEQEIERLHGEIRRLRGDTCTVEEPCGLCATCSYVAGTNQARYECARIAEKYAAGPHYSEAARLIRDDIEALP